MDITDGHFVSNLTMGMDITRAVCNFTGLRTDVHLMIEEPGRRITSYNVCYTKLLRLGGKRAVILKHHGVIAVGGNLKEALYAAIYMEEAAKAYLAAKAAGNVAIMTDEQTADAVEIHKSYGQNH